VNGHRCRSHSRKESDLGKTHDHMSVETQRGGRRPSQPIHASFKSDEAQLYNEMCDAALNLCGFAPATLF
jgi:hypothetical protein